MCTLWKPLPLCGVVCAEYCVVAVQAVLTGSQKVGAGRRGGEADVQRGGAALQHKQLTGGTNRNISTLQPGPFTNKHNPAGEECRFSSSQKV